MTPRIPSPDQPGFPPHVAWTLLVALALLGALPAPSSAQDTGGISGTVRSAYDGGLLPFVSVHVYDSGGNAAGSAVTDFSGTYSVSGLAAGTYFLRTSNTRVFVDELYNNITCIGGACSVTSGTGVVVTPPAVVSGIDFSLDVGVSISGGVFDGGSGTPLPGVLVNSLNSSGAQVGVGVVTDETGTFYIYGLPVGTYYVRTSNTLGYVDEIYLDVPCPGGSCPAMTTATALVLSAGETRGGVRFDLDLGASIAGTVTAAGSGAPLPGITVSVYNLNGLSLGNSTTDASGVYTRTNLLPGAYFVRTSNSAGYVDEVYHDIACPGGSCLPNTGMPVSAAAGATSGGIDFALAPGGSITGTVTASGSGAPLSGVIVRIYAASGGNLGSVTTNASGVYAKSGLATGTYFVLTSNSLGYVDELHNGLTCVGGTCTATSGTPVPVVSGAPTGGIDFSLSLGGTITGTVTAAASGAPLSSVRVYFYDGGGSPLGSVTTNSSGVYAKKGLPPGTFFARASPDGYASELYDKLPAWTATIGGTPIVVTAGATVTADFALGANPGPNTSATAVVLPLGTTEDLLYTGAQTADVVWYKFFVPPDAAGQDLKVNLRVTSPYPVPAPTSWRSDLDFDLLDEALLLRANAHGGTDNETLYLHDVASGWYYIYLDYCTTDYADAPVARYAITIETGTGFGLGYLTGRVVDREGQGLEQVQVEIRSVPYNHNTSFPTLLTGADGYFSFAAEPGLRDLFLTGDGNTSVNQPEVNVVSEFYLDSPSAAGASHLTVAAGGTIDLGAITVEVGAIVTGRVTNQAGAPLANAYVSGYDAAGNQTNWVRTDNAGHYSLTRVPIGGGGIRFARATYAPEYYDDQPSLGTGTVLATQPGVTLPGVDAQLTPGGTLSGSVKDLFGNPVALRVYLYSALDGIFPVSSYSVSATSGGVFAFGSVKPGEYTVYADTRLTGLQPAWCGGAATFAEAATFTVTERGLTAGCHIVLVPKPGIGDFDGDGMSDLLWRGAGGDLWLWGMDNAVHASDSFVGVVGDADWEIRGQADYTGDGKADLLWRHKTLGTLYLWEMNGATPAAERYVSTVDVSYDIVGSGDFDGDGKADVLWRNPALGDLWLWRMNGAAIVSQAYVDTVDLSYGVTGLGDLNGDLKTDVVWQGAAGDVWAWLMNGAVKDAQAYVGTVAASQYQIQQVADFDADLKADLLWWNSVAGDVWVWRMDGADVLSEHYVGLVANTNYRIQTTGDYNGDGKADLLWRNIVVGDLWVWLMDGPAKASEAYLGIVADQGYQVVR